MENIVNCKIDSLAWKQCTLPVKIGGLGIRDSSTLCFSAFLGSVNDSSYLFPKILPPEILSYPDLAMNEALNKYKNLSVISDTLSLKSQKEFDLNMCKVLFNNVFSSTESQINRARLLALQEPESNAWLNALPSSTLGNLLDDSTFRISVALRLGQPICEPHTCTCGEIVNKFGHHGLSCKKSAGRLARHRLINDIIKRSLVSAGFPAQLEPSGICRHDGKRVDGITLIPWNRGKTLVWDATCKDTICKSYLSKTSEKAGEAAKIGENQKINKYKELEDRGFLFCPFAVETLGPWGDEAKSLIFAISKKIDTKEAKSFITQRISIAIQRGNAASVLGTLPVESGLEEIFYL